MRNLRATGDGRPAVGAAAALAFVCLAGCSTTEHTKAADARAGRPGFGDVVHEDFGHAVREGSGAFAFVEASEARTVDGLWRLEGGGEALAFCAGAAPCARVPFVAGSNALMIVPERAEPCEADACGQVRHEDAAPSHPRGVWILGAGFASYCRIAGGAPRCDPARLGGEVVFVRAPIAAHHLERRGADVLWLERGPRSGSFVWMGVSRPERIVRCAAVGGGELTCQVPVTEEVP